MLIKEAAINLGMANSGETLSIDDDASSGGFEFDKNWEVIPPTSSYLGLSYGDWASRWLSWLINSDPDLNNNGPVIFLRGVDFVQRGGSYAHNIRLNGRRLRMSLGQAVFWPIIALFVDERGVPSLDTPQKRLADVYQGFQSTDSEPQPNQATIDGVPIVKSNLKDHLIFSPDFFLHVPKPSYQSQNTSTLGPLFKYPITYEGDWKSVVGGYFLLIKPTNKGLYTIASNGNAEDGYHTETFVQIEVTDDSPANQWEAQRERMKEFIRNEVSQTEAGGNKVGQITTEELKVPIKTLVEFIDKSHSRRPESSTSEPQFKKKTNN